ncbi:MAG: PH domain-containing protein [Candidatus Magasanikbacteria bacterium]|nr:PH domain-containing protein [Candidatus Magasanikbacteria bacterium]
MNPLTEKNYPVQARWLIYAGVVYLPVLIIAALLSAWTREWFLAATAFFGLVFFLNLIMRANFHFTIDDGPFLTVRQGLSVFWQQEKQSPYGRIQNVLINRGIFDRLLGLSTLVIENASAGGQSGLGRRGTQGPLGFFGNRITIPGLTQAHAEELKALLLQKIKEHPLSDARSGL